MVRIIDILQIYGIYSIDIGYKYILDILDHYTKWYQGYCLKTKTSEEILSCIESYIQCFGKPIILQADNGLEFSNIYLKNIV